MKETSLKKSISLLVSLAITVGMLVVPIPFFASAEDYGWNISEREYASKSFTIEAFSAASSDISVTLDGVALEGGDVTESEGVNTRSFTVDTTAYAEETHVFALLIGGESVAEKSILFDNTAPYIRSWPAIDVLGHKYTAYDMEVVPDDIIVLSEGESFLVDFNPTEEGSGMKSITVSIDSKRITVPYEVPYDFLAAGMHTLSYTLTDNAGNYTSSLVRFETRKPAPAYSEMTTEKIDDGYKLSAKISGSFKNYSAKFYLAEILPVTARENVASGDISVLCPEGERDFLASRSGEFLTKAYNGDELYQTYYVNVKGKNGSVYADAQCQANKGDTIQIYLYKTETESWELIQEKTATTGTVALNIGKRGVDIPSYSVNNTLPVRIRVVSNKSDKCLKTLSFVSGVRYNSPIGEAQSGAVNSIASVTYTGNVTSSMGWYVYATADLYNSYSPICSFRTSTENTIAIEQYNAVFNGDTSTRVSLTWQTAESTKTHVQIISYGNIYPDFTSTSVRSYTGTTSAVSETGKYSHKVRITGLTPGAKYWVRYGDKNLNEWSEPCIVEMPTADGAFSFAAGTPSGTSEKIVSAWDKLAWSNMPDFVLTTGNEATGEEAWNQYFESISCITDNVKLVPTVGTSDSSVWWTKYNFSEQSGAGHANGVYYSFNYKNALFVVLNSNDVNASGELNSAQLKWINKVMAADSSDWKFVLLNAQIDSSDSTLAKQLKPLFSEWGVDIVFTSGGKGFSGDLGEEKYTYNEKEYYSDADTLYISTKNMETQMPTVSVDGYTLKISCYGKEAELFSKSRFEIINDRIDALPSVENLTVNYYTEVLAIRALCDSTDSELLEEFVTDIAKLEAVESKMDEIVKLAPPTIKVSGKFPKRALFGTSLKLLSATATDIPDGSINVTVKVLDPNGDEAVIENGSITFTAYGNYTIIYSAVDSDENTASVSYTVPVPEYSRFDLDDDGKIGIGDALIAIRLAAKRLTADSLDIAIADADEDGEITVTDALHILRIVTGIISR